MGRYAAYFGWPILALSRCVGIRRRIQPPLSPTRCTRRIRPEKAFGPASVGRLPPTIPERATGRSSAPGKPGPDAREAPVPAFPIVETPTSPVSPEQLPNRYDKKSTLSLHFLTTFRLLGGDRGG